MKSKSDLEKIAKDICNRCMRFFIALDKHEQERMIDFVLSKLQCVQDEAVHDFIKFSNDELPNLRANMKPAPQEDPVDKAIKEILEKSAEIKEQFIKTWVAVRVEPGMRNEHIKAILNTMAVYEQRDGLTTKWFLGLKPELTAPQMPSDEMFSSESILKAAQESAINEIKRIDGPESICGFSSPSDEGYLKSWWPPGFIAGVNWFKAQLNKEKL